MGVTKYLIQGFWFQPREKVELREQPTKNVVVTLEHASMRDMFAGMIYPSNEDSLSNIDVEWIGRLHDPMGRSRLTNIVIEPHHFSFTKYYDGDAMPIEYRFELQGSTWVGEFASERLGRGTAICILTQVSDATESSSVPSGS